MYILEKGNVVKYVSALSAKERLIKAGYALKSAELPAKKPTKKPEKKTED